jgi:hypothetical protein
MIKERCFTLIDEVNSSILSWAKEKGISIFRIENVATFENWDNGIGVYIFYPNDEYKEKSDSQGFNSQIEKQYLDLLKILGYPFDKFPNVTFYFDSHENVINNYEGSYFYRLR